MRKHRLFGWEAQVRPSGTLRPTIALRLGIASGLLGAMMVSQVVLADGNASAASASVGAGATCSGSTGSGSPGVTSKNINVAAVSTQTGALAANFDAFVPGVRAYFQYINALGGVNGRTLSLAYSLDDGSNPSQFSQLTHTAIDQDHAFAVMIASPFFAPNYYVETCTPAYGYNVTANWADEANLFAAGGSTLYNPQVATQVAYLMRQEHVKSFATLAYNVSESSGVCSDVNTYLAKAGFTQAYTDLNVSYGGNVTPDVQRLRNSGAQMVVSCMTVTQNVQLAQDIKSYGIKTKQYWLNGSDQGVLNQYQGVMQGVYFGVQHVPFTANTKYYPGIKTYLTAMNKYAPKYTYDELSIQGWASAALFAQGVKLAGSNLTQANLIKQTNLLTSYTAGDIYAVANWTTAHSEENPPFCDAYIQVQGKKYVSVFGKGHQAYVCFNINKSNPTPTNTTPVAAPAGTPGT